MIRIYKENRKNIKAGVQMIIFKINEVPTSKEGLKQRVQRAWKINPSRLYN